jgi:hypothetical protein
MISRDPKKYIFPCWYLALKVEEIDFDFATLAKQIGDKLYTGISCVKMG